MQLLLLGLLVKCILTVEVDGVFLDFNVVALAIGFLYLTLMIGQVLLRNGNDRGVTEFIHWAQVYKRMLIETNYLARIC